MHTVIQYLKSTLLNTDISFVSPWHIYIHTYTYIDYLYIEFIYILQNKTKPPLGFES